MRSIVTILLLSAALACGRTPENQVRLAAASDLAGALDELGPAFTAATGRRLEVTLGSSGLLARQIAAGAPFDAFASADPAYVDDVARNGACVGTTRADYAQGRIAIFVPRTGPVARPVALGSLAGPEFRRIAIANPEHAPYGRAARQALADAGIDQAVTSRLVLGENVRQTLQLADSGNVEAAIVAWPLIKNRTDGQRVLIDAAAHRPIRQVVVACRRGRSASGGTAFARYLTEPAAQRILRRHGFDEPFSTP